MFIDSAVPTYQARAVDAIDTSNIDHAIDATVACNAHSTMSAIGATITQPALGNVGTICVSSAVFGACIDGAWGGHGDVEVEVEVEVVMEAEENSRGKRREQIFCGALRTDHVVLTSAMNSHVVKQSGLSNLEESYDCHCPVHEVPGRLLMTFHSSS
jgi:hypothetical protein